MASLRPPDLPARATKRKRLVGRPSIVAVHAIAAMAPARIALLGTGTVGRALLARLASWRDAPVGRGLQLVYAANSRLAVHPCAGVRAPPASGASDWLACFPAGAAEATTSTAKTANARAVKTLIRRIELPSAATTCFPAEPPLSARRKRTWPEAARHPSNGLGRFRKGSQPKARAFACVRAA